MGWYCRKRGGNRRFSVLIGESEAQSITLKLRHKRLPRPLTHELVNNMLLTLGYELEKVLLYALVNDIFYAELHIKGYDGSACTVDARTSDAVALAMQAECPIYIKAEILDLVATEVSPRKQPETLDEVEDAAPDELKAARPSCLGTLAATGRGGRAVRTGRQTEKSNGVGGAGSPNRMDS